MRIAILGIGRMGGRIALKLYREGHDVLVWNRSKEAVFKFLEYEKPGLISFKRKSLKAADTIEDLVFSMRKPRIFWLMLPSGKPTEEVLKELSKYIEKGDTIVDGGNANFKDTERRYRDFKKRGIQYLGIGVSGGIIAAENGYPLMVGGSRKAFKHIEPVLKTLAKPNGGYAYFGEGGAGHFVKMVHNGIEYGIMQSLGEGFEVLEKSKYKLNLQEAAKIFQKGTIISGFLMDLLSISLKNNKKLSGMEGPVSQSGEALWTVEEAKKEKVNVKVIEESLNYRLRTQKDKKLQQTFTAKVLNALRNAFGGHLIEGREVKK